MSSAKLGLSLCGETRLRAAHGLCSPAPQFGPGLNKPPKKPYENPLFTCPPQTFTLDGASGYVDVPDGPGLNPTAAITVEAWIYPQLPLNSIGSPIVKKAGDGGGTTHGYSLELYGTSAVAFWVYRGGWIPSPAAALPTNQWSHVAGVYDGNTIS